MHTLVLGGGTMGQVGQWDRWDNGTGGTMGQVGQVAAVKSHNVKPKKKSDTILASRACTVVAQSCTKSLTNSRLKCNTILSFNDHLPMRLSKPVLLNINSYTSKKQLFCNRCNQCLNLGLYVWLSVV